MGITPFIQKAITKIGEIHRDQSRKAEQFPYVVHPYAVAILLSRYTNDEKIIVAGLLHDVLEDVDPAIYGPAEICRDFSEEICQIVQEVSVMETAQHHPTAPPLDKGRLGGVDWLERKQRYLKQLNTASEAALMICAADKIHFLQSIMTSYGEYGEALWDKLNPSVSPQQRLWFCQAVLQILQNRLDNPIVTKFTAIIEIATPILQPSTKIQI